MIIAVDVGGTKTLVGGFADGPHIFSEERIPTPQDQHEFLVELRKLLEHFKDDPVDAISIGVPAILNNEGVILKCANLPWKNFKLKQILEEQYKCPVFIQNDANMAALGESSFLKTIPPLVMYVTVSTGIGTGLVLDGSLVPGLSHSEGGHIVIKTTNGWQSWESLASGRAIMTRFGKKANDIEDVETWHQIANDLALGFQALIPAIQPDLIIIGGSVGTYFDRFGHLLQEILRHRMHDIVDVPPFQKAAHPEEAVLYGCYYYAQTNQKTS